MSAAAHAGLWVAHSMHIAHHPLGFPHADTLLNRPPSSSREYDACQRIGMPISHHTRVR
ncbi:hypothetical protein B0O80DRAFT_439172 [Mortierella sp. GBAus27b]|nr:hypothetical protein B0O80DRAFT_439172 [Mortierella sp. GBAus27b]